MGCFVSMQDTWADGGSSQGLSFKVGNAQGIETCWELEADS